MLRGSARDAQVHRTLTTCQVAPLTAKIGRAARELLGRTGRKDTIDSVVVTMAAALPQPVLIVTSDPEDIGALAEEFPGVRIRIV